MSNTLNVRRVRIQEIDSRGNALGMPSYGVLAIDNYEEGFTAAYDTLADLNAAIDEQGSILAVVGGFESYNHARVGTRNYNGPAADLQE